MTLIKYIAAGMFCSLCAGTMAAPVVTWKQFTSSLHYSIEYPSNWTFASRGPESLDITSSSQYLEGVGIAPNEGEIIVSKAQAKPLNDLIKSLTKDETVISQHALQSPGAKSDGCSVITQAMSKDEIGPNTFITNTRFFCETHDGIFIALLRNWPSDPEKEKYQQIAIHMVRSLRVGTPNVANELPYTPMSQPVPATPSSR